MPNVTLPVSGEPVKVAVAHTYYDIVTGEFYKREDVTKEVNMNGMRLSELLRPVTTVRLTFSDGTNVYGDAVCQPPDNFCKATGRKIAASRLLERLRKYRLFGKQDRRAIFAVVCPEYFKKGKKN